VTSSTHQIQFDCSTGDVHFVFGQLDTVSVSGWAGAEGWIVGFTVAGPSADPGSIDLSATLAGSSITTFPQDTDPLALETAAVPIVNTTISLDVSNITPTAPFGGSVATEVRKPHAQVGQLAQAVRRPLEVRQGVEPVRPPSGDAARAVVGHRVAKTPYRRSGVAGRGRMSHSIDRSCGNTGVR